MNKAESMAMGIFEKNRMKVANDSSIDIFELIKIAKQQDYLYRLRWERFDKRMRKDANFG